MYLIALILVSTVTHSKQAFRCFTPTAVLPAIYSILFIVEEKYKITYDNGYSYLLQRKKKKKLEEQKLQLRDTRTVGSEIQC